MTTIANADAVTPAVRAVMASTTDPRLREIMTSLIAHLHGFVREVRLTEAEFQQATRLLNTMDQQSNASHNEFVLMAGSLGVSPLVCLLSNGDGDATETTQSMPGPFWRATQPMTENGGSDPALGRAGAADVRAVRVRRCRGRAGRGAGG
jgi:catechol 1,2-dioxygenase